MAIPGNPLPTAAELQLAALQDSISGGVARVHFQDRDVTYVTLKDRIAAYQFAYLLQNPNGAHRTLRVYTTKGL